jgi:sulfatase modifying factor 1
MLIKGKVYITVAALILVFVFEGCQSYTDTNGQVWFSSLNLMVDRYEVSIGDFREFISTTTYITTADSMMWSGVFDINQGSWIATPNANWEKPTGDSIYLDNFPVTQVSYFDACAYCEWKNGRLPSAKEWDTIAGEEVIIGNTWEGSFPYYDYGLDGYAHSIAPIGKFKPNKMGVHDLFGNVWEWTTTRSSDGTYITKGGSFLCDKDVCTGYIPSRYQTTPDDSGLNHLGFRCVYDKK